MKRIGIIDHCLDNFHARVYLAALRGPLAHRGYQIVGATADNTETSRSWALANDVPYYHSVGELAGCCDVFMILAPSNPELHLGMCEEAFPYSKPTFVDKTFAPNLSTALQIFALADQYQVPTQSTSALRTSNVQEELSGHDKPLSSLFITSSGPTFSEYGIHPIELAVSCLGASVESVMSLGQPSHPQIVLKYADRRTAIIDFNTQAELPFTANLIFEDGTSYVEVAGDRLFVDAASSILDFFDAGQSRIDRAETLIIREILDLLDAKPPLGEFIHLKKSSKHSPMPRPHWQRQPDTIRG